MYPNHNPDDFFNNPMAAPPKPAMSVNKTRQTTSTSTAARKPKAPPPPPRRQQAKPQQRLGSKKGARPSSTVSATTPTMNTTSTSSGMNRRRQPKPAGGQRQTMQSSSAFYGSTNPTATKPPAQTTTQADNSSYYTAAATTSTAATNDWDSWAAPAPATNNTTSASNPSSWAAPAATSAQDWSAPAPTSTSTPSPAPAASTNDWYSSSNMKETAATTSSTPFYAGTSNNSSQTFNPSSSTSSSTATTIQGAMQSQGPLQGSMDSVTPTIFQPQQYSASSANNSTNAPTEDFENEPPLLEELGIHFDHILLKTKTVCWPFQRSKNVDKTEMVNAVVQDAEIVGPICYCLLLGGEMVLAGKLQFGYIYGFGMFGCLAMTLVVNLMAPSDAVSFWVVSSVLGYALIPVNILALLKIIVINMASMQMLGRLLGVMTVLWSTTASTRLLEIGCGLREQRYLIAYPIALLYSAFVLITIF